MIKTTKNEVNDRLAKHLDRLWRYAYVLTGRRDTAEDLVQATCVRALEKAYQFRSGSKLDHWLFAILRSIWLNELRAQKLRRTEDIFEHENASAHDGAAEIETAVHTQQVLKAMAELPEDQRMVLLLVCVEGYSYRDAAEAMEIPVMAAKTALAATVAMPSPPLSFLNAEFAAA